MIGVKKSLDQDKARHFVRPDLGPNCLQRLSAEDSKRTLTITLSHCTNVHVPTTTTTVLLPFWL